MNDATTGSDGPHTAKARDELRLLGVAALYVVSIAALLRALMSLIDNPMAAAVMGAAAVSLIAGHADVPSEAFGPNVRKRMAWGVGIAAVAVVVGVVTGVATGGGITLSGFSVASAFGIAEAVGVGYTREMWLRGIPLTFARRIGVPDRHAFVFTAMAGVATIVLEKNVTPVGLVLTAASSAAFTALWIRGKDGHAPIAAHVVWIWLTDAALTGELFQLSTPGGILTSGPNASGNVALAAAAVFAAVVLAVLTNKIDIARIAAPPEATAPPKQPRKARTKKRRKKKRPRREP